MDRAQRRLNANKAKLKAKSKLAFWGQLGYGLSPTPRQIGKAASMHNTCPCWMCTDKHPPTNKYKSGYPAIHGDV